jgi:hypothetical protein
MNQRPSDRLSTSLRSLDEPRASDGFTERVLEGLDQRLRRRARLRATALAAASVALVTLVALGAVLRPRSADLARARADEIRREHTLLLEELEELKRSRDLTPAVLYLGGEDDYDLVLDLNPLLEEMTRPTAAPAALAPGARPARGTDATRRRP